MPNLNPYAAAQTWAQSIRDVHVNTLVRRVNKMFPLVLVDKMTSRRTSTAERALKSTLLAIYLVPIILSVIKLCPPTDVYVVILLFDRICTFAIALYSIWAVWKTDKKDALCLDDLESFDRAANVEDEETTGVFAVCSVVFAQCYWIAFLVVPLTELSIVDFFDCLLWVTFLNSFSQELLLKYLLAKRFDVYVAKHLDRGNVPDHLPVFRELLDANQRLVESNSIPAFLVAMPLLSSNLLTFANCWKKYVLEGEISHDSVTVYVQVAVLQAYLVTMVRKSDLQERLDAVDFELDRRITEGAGDLDLATRKRIFQVMQILSLESTQMTALEMFDIDGFSISSAFLYTLNLYMVLMEFL